MHEDLRYAIRALRQSPAFTITATLTLALGIGANTAIFGLINGFSRPLPVPNADRIVILATRVAGDDSGLHYRFSFPALEDFRRQATVFSDVFGFDLRLGGLSVNGTTTPFVYQAVTGNFFSGLDLRPAAGRFLRAGEGEHAGAPITIVLGHGYWQKRFGGDPNVVGSGVRLDGQFATVIGVAPEGFHGLFNGVESDGYPSLSAIATLRDGHDLFADRSDRFLTAVARMKPGVSLSAAQDAATVIARRLETAYPDTDGRATVRVTPETLARPLPLPFVDRFLPTIKFLMFVLAALVLVIACMNVTNLMLVRATARQHEMAIRAALGSAPRRLFRLVLSEASVLAVLGMTAGLVIGRWVLAVLIASLDIDAVSQTTGLTLNLAAVNFDGPVYAYAAGMALASAALVAMVPAWRAGGANVHALLHQGGRTHAGGGSRFRAWLVVAQVAGSLVLLIVSGLLVRNLVHAQQVDLGFDPSHVVAARIDSHHVGYDQARSRTFFDELERRLLALPGTESAAQSFTVPLSYVVGEGAPILREGEIVRPDDPQPVIGYNTVSPGYFDTLRLPILRGRGFTTEDGSDTSAPVAIVNETLAGRLWPGEDPIGRRFSLPDDNSAMRQVVGVVRDSKYIAVFEGSLPHFYLPLRSERLARRSILVRSAMPQDALSAAVRAQVAALDPEMPISDIAPLERTIAGNIGFLLFRVGALEAAALGMLGLVLAVVGVYGVVSYGASQQTRSIGIRLALGADAGDVRRLVLGQGARLIAAGVALGLIGTVAFTRAIHGMLVVVDTSDPLTFLIVTTALVAAGLIACYLPAHRATRVDPVVVLRSE
jgi:predicted permease